MIRTRTKAKQVLFHLLALLGALPGRGAEIVGLGCLVAVELCALLGDAFHQGLGADVPGIGDTERVCLDFEGFEFFGGGKRSTVCGGVIHKLVPGCVCC